MRKIICFACALCTIIAGCTNTKAPTNNKDDISLGVYCIQGSETKKEPRKLTTVERNFSSKIGEQKLVHEIIDEMKRIDEYDIYSALPANIEAEQVVFYGNSVVVNLSKEYNSLSAIDKSLTAGALALTLTQLNSVNFVKISCVDAKYDLSNDFYLNRDSIIMDEDAIRFNAFDIELVNINSQTNKLEKRRETIKTEQDKVIASMIFSELMRKPADANLSSPIPEGMMARTIKLSNGICTIDFMEAGRNTINKLDALHITAIANTFCLHHEVKAVKIRIDGKSLSEYGIYGFDGEIAYDKRYD